MRLQQHLKKVRDEEIEKAKGEKDGIDNSMDKSNTEQTQSGKGGGSGDDEGVVPKVLVAEWVQRNQQSLQEAARLRTLRKERLQRAVSRSSQWMKKSLTASIRDSVTDSKTDDGENISVHSESTGDFGTFGSRPGSRYSTTSLASTSSLRAALGLAPQIVHRGLSRRTIAAYGGNTTRRGTGGRRRKRRGRGRGRSSTSRRGRGKRFGSPTRTRGRSKGRSGGRGRKSSRKGMNLPTGRGKKDDKRKGLGNDRTDSEIDGSNNNQPTSLVESLSETGSSIGRDLNSVISRATTSSTESDIEKNDHQGIKAVAALASSLSTRDVSPEFDDDLKEEEALDDAFKEDSDDIVESDEEEEDLLVDEEVEENALLDEAPDAMGDDDVTAEEAKLVSLDKLSQQWFEVTCLLRHDFGSPESYHSGVELVANAAKALQNIEEASTRRNVNLGKAYQALIHDSSKQSNLKGITRNADHYAAYSKDVDQLGLSNSEWQKLRDGAEALRSLVRIKLEDANDLESARMAIELAGVFFASVQLHAKAREIDAFEMAKSLDQIN
eukprot:g6082.t1